VSKYSKEFIKEQVQLFTPKELKAFKRLVKEFNYPVDRAFEKILVLKRREEQKSQTPQPSLEPQEQNSQNQPPKNQEDSATKSSSQKESKEIAKNEGGQNIIKPVDSEEFELIGIKEDDEVPDFGKRTKDFSEDEIIPVVESKELELQSLTKKGREVYESSIRLGKSHEQALQDAYRESKKELAKRLEQLEAFFQPKSEF
jgi:hypothetical protein